MFFIVRPQLFGRGRSRQQFDGQTAHDSGNGRGELVVALRSVDPAGQRKGIAVRGGTHAHRDVAAPLDGVDPVPERNLERGDLEGTHRRLEMQRERAARSGDRQRLVVGVVVLEIGAAGRRIPLVGPGKQQLGRSIARGEDDRKAAHDARHFERQGSVGGRTDRAGDRAVVALDALHAHFGLARPSDRIAVLGLGHRSVLDREAAPRRRLERQVDRAVGIAGEKDRLVAGAGAGEVGARRERIAFVGPGDRFRRTRAVVVVAGDSAQGDGRKGHPFAEVIRFFHFYRFLV